MFGFFDIFKDRSPKRTQTAPNIDRITASTRAPSREQPKEDQEQILFQRVQELLQKYPSELTTQFTDPNLKEALTKLLGKTATDQLIQQPEYLRALQDLERDILAFEKDFGQTIFDRSLVSLISIHETLGEHWQELIESTDLARWCDDEALEKYDENTKLVGSIKCNATNHTLYQVRIERMYNLADDQNVYDSESIEEEPAIKRRFERLRDERTAEWVTNGFTVFHDKLALPDSWQGQHIALQITQAGLELYDNLGVDTMRLLANGTMGSYAFAVYGFGWEKPENADDVTSITRLAKDGVAEAYRQAGCSLTDPDIWNCLQAYEDLANHPDTTTPQALATIGLQGPKLVLGRDERWHKAPYTGDVGEVQGECHAGKIGLLNVAKVRGGWEGKLPLKQRGDGSGRALLETRIQAILGTTYAKAA